jgi:hypothetical protein
MVASLTLRQQAGKSKAQSRSFHDRLRLLLFLQLHLRVGYRPASLSDEARIPRLPQVKVTTPQHRLAYASDAFENPPSARSKNGYQHRSSLVGVHPRTAASSTSTNFHHPSPFHGVARAKHARIAQAGKQSYHHCG